MAIGNAKCHVQISNELLHVFPFLRTTENNQLSYAVLWLPNRFAMLYCYLTIITFLVSVVTIRCCCNRIDRHRVETAAAAQKHQHIAYKRLSAV